MISVTVDLSWKWKMMTCCSLTDLLFSLRFLDVVSSHFDPRGQDGSGELHDIQTQQMTELLGSWETEMGKTHNREYTVI